MEAFFTTIGEFALTFGVTVTAALTIFTVLELVVISTTASIKRISQVLVVLDEHIKSLRGTIQDIKDEVNQNRE